MLRHQTVSLLKHPGGICQPYMRAISSLQLRTCSPVTCFPLTTRPQTTTRPSNISIKAFGLNNLEYSLHNKGYARRRKGLSAGQLGSSRMASGLSGVANDAGVQNAAVVAALNAQAETQAEASSVSDTSAGADVADKGPVVQHIIMRRDLVDTLNWPLGSVVSQGCHASVAAMWMYKDDAVVQRYCGPDNLDSMHKVVLEVKGEMQLRKLSEKLAEAGVDHKLWIEQPENVATCLATKPHHKADVAPHFKRLKLFK
eukprot:jgi/Mesen1/5957/ME000301S05085